MNKNDTYKFFYRLILGVFLFGQFWINVGSILYQAFDENQVLIELVNMEDKESESESEKDKKEKIESFEKNGTNKFLDLNSIIFSSQNGDKLWSSQFAKIITPPPQF